MNLRCRFQGIMDLSCNEKEDDRVGTDHHQSWQKKCHEDGQLGVHVTHPSNVPIFLSKSNTKAETEGNNPTDHVVPLLQSLSLSVSSDNHLIKIECDTETPAEIRQKKVMDHDGSWNAHESVVNVKRDQKKKSEPT